MLFPEKGIKNARLTTLLDRAQGSDYLYCPARAVELHLLGVGASYGAVDHGWRSQGGFGECHDDGHAAQPEESRSR